MPHNNRIRLSGTWTDGSVVLSEEMERLDAAQYAAIHEGGGTWASTSQIILGGAGMRVTGPLVADDLSGHVKSGQTLTADLGGTVAVKGVLDIQGGGVEKIEAGGLLRVLGAIGNAGRVKVEAFGILSVESAGTINVNDSGFLHVQSGGILRVQPGGAIEIGGVDGLVVKNGFNAKVEAGASLDVFGSFISYGSSDFQAGFTCAGTGYFSSFLTLAASGQMKLFGSADLIGPAKIVAQGTSGNVAKFEVSSNAELYFTGGTITGAVIVTGDTTFNNTAHFEHLAIFNDGASFAGGKTLRAFDGAFVTFDAVNFTIGTGAAFLVKSPMTFEGAQIPSGVSAWRAKRPVDVGPDGTSSISMTSLDFVRVPLPGPATAWRWKVLVPPAPTSMYVLCAATGALNADLTLYWTHPTAGDIDLCTFGSAGGGRAGVEILYDGALMWANGHHGAVTVL